jgi:hypothetical protein
VPQIPSEAGEGGLWPQATAWQATLPGHKAGAAGTPNQNIENNPMQSRPWAAGMAACQDLYPLLDHRSMPTISGAPADTRKMNHF